MLIIVILAYTLVFFIDQSNLIKKGLKNDLYVNTALSVVSIIIAILLVLHIRIPSPANPIEKVVKYFLTKG